MKNRLTNYRAKLNAQNKTVDKDAERSELIAQIAAHMDRQVSIEDFVPCARLIPTEIGLARCQSSSFAEALVRMTEHLHNCGKFRNEDIPEGADLMMQYTMYVLCGNADRFVEAREDCSDAVVFLRQNQRPLACLVEVAFISNFPEALKECGFQAVPN